jgi:hypothetical protein
MSDENEQDMNGRMVTNLLFGVEFADYALRTCLCGYDIDGFDDYWQHLNEMFTLNEETEEVIRAR